MCKEAKEQMPNIPGERLGSWERTVPTCDGCCQIRGHFIQNHTFAVKIGSLRINDVRTTAQLGHLIVPCRHPVEIYKGPLRVVC